MITHAKIMDVNDSLKWRNREFPGSPVVRTLRFHCKGHGFDPWSGN